MKRKKIKKGFIIILLFSVLLLNLMGCGMKAKEPMTKTKIMLNTYVTITLYDHQDMGLIEECFDLCEEYEQMFSRTLANSEVSQFNLKETGEYEVSEELYELLELSMEYSELTGGAFDVTIEPVSSLWDFSSLEPVVPEPDTLKKELENVGYEKLQLENGRVIKKNAATGIDLGAVAKGYIADKLKEYLVSKGVESAIIDLGGNIVLIGGKPDGTEFSIGIQRPFEDRNEIIGTIALKDYAAVSSGIYERCFWEEGIFYHHILNPQTGYPCESDLVGVTILAPEATRADALSTTCFILGKEKGMELMDSLDGVYAVFITKDGEIEYSKGLEENFQVNKNHE